MDEQSLGDVEEPEVEGVIPRPGLELAFELRLLPKRLPNWMGGPSGGLLESLMELLVVAAVGDRWGVKLILFRGPTAWLRSVSSLRHIVVFEVWPEIESCERRAREVRRSVEAGDYDNAEPLSRAQRRIVLREDAKD